MKRELIILCFLLSNIYLYAQVPTTDLTKAYMFSNLDLTNTANSGTYDITVSGTNNTTATSDPNNTAFEAIDINATSLNAGPHPTQQGDFTISFWIKTTGSSGRIINQLSNSGSFNAGYYFDIDISGGLVFTGNFRYGSNYSNQGTIFSPNINDGNWHHIVVTGKNIKRVQNFPTGGSNTFNSYRYVMYKDNVLVNTSSTSELIENPGTGQQVFLFNDNPDLILGSAVYNDDFDNYREYTRVLTTTDITNLFNEFNFSLSVFDFQKNDVHIKIYPNPTSKTLNISTEKDIETVEVYNLLGVQVIQSKNRNLDVSALQNGMYLIKVTTKSNQQITKRFIKK